MCKRRTGIRSRLIFIPRRVDHTGTPASCRPHVRRGTSSPPTARCWPCGITGCWPRRRDGIRVWILGLERRRLSEDWSSASTTSSCLSISLGLGLSQASERVLADRPYLPRGAENVLYRFNYSICRWFEASFLKNRVWFSIDKWFQMNGSKMLMTE